MRVFLVYLYSWTGRCQRRGVVAIMGGVGSGPGVQCSMRRVSRPSQRGCHQLCFVLPWRLWV